MSNPFMQASVVGDALNEAVDPNKVGIIEAMLFKFFIAFLITGSVWIYFDKNSKLNDLSPQENKKKFSYRYKGDDDNVDKDKDKDKEKLAGKSGVLENVKEEVEDSESKKES
ncbi:hypothetical protein CANARDRAFT_25725 [[Candida] arabinofermentans NRRL YB-2248]|uniref:Uncharacterized protein n=1 Tax=[Candida] arabinofermentans NRRL YB-2248 TaxID=983967 RepID=A0A1E4ST49_9ASCO|nr:hypothetical protein CANARDRAFT_25725 [[Candida] arabinofermentans NRRL YB-2248]